MVVSLFAIRLTTTANIGLNPNVTSMAAGMATDVPYPAIPSSRLPNPHVIRRTCMLLSFEMLDSWAFITSMCFEWSKML